MTIAMISRTFTGNERDVETASITSGLRIHRSGLLRVVSNTPIPFRVQGTRESPVFRPDLKEAVKEKVVSVEKGVGGLVKGLLGGK